MNDVTAVYRQETVEHGGKTWAVKRPSFLVEGALGTWLENRAVRAIQRNRAVLGEDGYREAMGAFQRDCATGEYSWGSRTVGLALQNPECLKELLFLVLSQSHEGLDRDTYAALWDAKAGELIEAFGRLMGPTPTTGQQ